MRSSKGRLIRQRTVEILTRHSIGWLIQRTEKILKSLHIRRGEGKGSFHIDIAFLVLSRRSTSRRTEIMGRRSSGGEFSFHGVNRCVTFECFLEIFRSSYSIERKHVAMWSDSIERKNKPYSKGSVNIWPYNFEMRWLMRTVTTCFVVSMNNHRF